MEKSLLTIIGNPLAWKAEKLKGIPFPPPGKARLFEKASEITESDLFEKILATRDEMPKTKEEYLAGMTEPPEILGQLSAPYYTLMASYKFVEPFLGMVTKLEISPTYEFKEVKFKSFNLASASFFTPPAIYNSLYMTSLLNAGFIDSGSIFNPNIRSFDKRTLYKSHPRTIHIGSPPYFPPTIDEYADYLKTKKSLKNRLIEKMSGEKQTTLSEMGTVYSNAKKELEAIHDYVISTHIGDIFSCTTEKECFGIENKDLETMV